MAESTDNLAAVLHGIDDLRMEQIPIPVPGPHQVLVRVHTVGICGSDVHYWTHGAIGNFVVREPMVVGHETSGVVAGVGSEVKDFQVGDRIAMEPGLPCKGCEHCKKGRYNLCADMKFFATPPINGTLARYVVHDSAFCYKWCSFVGTSVGVTSPLEPEKAVGRGDEGREDGRSRKFSSNSQIEEWEPFQVLRDFHELLIQPINGAFPLQNPSEDVILHRPHRLRGPRRLGQRPSLAPVGRLPDNVSFEDGSLLEPLSVAVHACRRANLQMGNRVLVLGAGPIGVLNMMTAKAAGAGRVIVTDLDDSRLALAKKLGADEVINVRNKRVVDIRAEIILAMGSEPDISIECTGAQPCVETAIMTTISGGVIVLVGLGASRIEIPIIESACREVDIRGIFRYVNCYPTALELVASGRIDLSGLTRAHYPLEQTLEAFKRTQKADVVKVFIQC
ncbi:unnamed protein product [Caenorhabditis auriculariae]|uniref:Sorbitol dehydrogenase n=1 Tax=Caenorhabditis auriculariae TaxID=2777116 RepID=A0A8S1HIY5_9PELO|nr:unnamed protein product [Caenorhabditis auriculariae]